MTIKELKEEMKTWSVSKLSKNCSFVLTIFLWFVLLIVFIFVNPVKKEPKYKEIQIVLEPIKKVEKKEKVSSAKQQATSKKTEETKTLTEQKVPPKQEVKKDIQKEVAKSSKAENTVAKKTETKPKPVEKKAEITPKTTPTPAKTVPKSEPVKYAKSVDDLMEEQFSEKKNVSDFDWDSMFDESEDSETSNLSTTKKVTTKNTVQGTAGTVSDKNSEPIVSSKSNGEKSAKVSDNTSGKLSDISNKKYSGKSTVSDAATVQVATGSNEKGTVKMQNGMSRMLLYPAEPNIIISDENARLIENTVTVKITFTVLESGNVPSAEISITPASLLPSAVRNEIVSQLSKWRFESADYVAAATLELTIVKK